MASSVEEGMRSHATPAEEKTHVGEFQTPLLMKDRELEGELKEGSKEVEALIRNVTEEP